LFMSIIISCMHFSLWPLPCIHCLAARSGRQWRSLEENFGRAKLKKNTNNYNLFNRSYRIALKQNKACQLGCRITTANCLAAYNCCISAWGRSLGIWGWGLGAPSPAGTTRCWTVAVCRQSGRYSLICPS
jgi:hypothetical protein